MIHNSVMLKDVDYSSCAKKIIGDGSVQSLNMDDYDHFEFCTPSLYLSQCRTVDFGAETG